MDAFLEQAVASNAFTLLDFHATWCEPCKWVDPLLVDIIKHFEGKIVLQKIDIDEHPDLAKQMHVLSVPTIVLYKGNIEAWRIRGFDTLPKMISEIEKHLA
jgi:thioredoxin 1